MIPDVDKKLLNVMVHGSSDAIGLDLKFQIQDSNKEIASITAKVGKTFQVNMSKMAHHETPFVVSSANFCLGPSIMSEANRLCEARSDMLSRPAICTCCQTFARSQIFGSLDNLDRFQAMI